MLAKLSACVLSDIRSFSINRIVQMQVQDTERRQDLKQTGIVLIHGLTGTPTEMKPLEKHLRRLGFDVENVLLAGHGGSYDQILHSSWHEWLESAREGVRRILERNERAVICGLSMGAIISAKIATEESRVGGVVLLSPTLSYDGSILLNSAFDNFVHSHIVHRIMRKVVKGFPVIGRKIYWEESPPYGISDERIQRQITKSIEAARQGGSNDFGVFRTYYGPLAQMWSLIDEAKQDFAKLECPVLMAHSMDDTIASIHNASETYMRIGSNNKSLVYLTGCDHVMTLDLQKHKVMSLLANFVEYINSNDKKHVSSIVPSALLTGKTERPGAETTITLSNEHSSEQHSLHFRHSGKAVLSLSLFTSKFQLALLKTKQPRPVLRSGHRLLPGLLSPNVLGVASQGHKVHSKEWLTENNDKGLKYLGSVIESIARTTKAELLSAPLQTLTQSPDKALSVMETSTEQLQHKNAFVNKLLGLKPGALAYLPQNELVEEQLYDEAFAGTG